MLNHWRHTAGLTSPKVLHLTSVSLAEEKKEKHGPLVTSGGNGFLVTSGRSWLLGTLVF